MVSGPRAAASFPLLLASCEGMSRCLGLGRRRSRVCRAAINSSPSPNAPRATNHGVNGELAGWLWRRRVLGDRACAGWGVAECAGVDPEPGWCCLDAPGSARTRLVLRGTCRDRPRTRLVPQLHLVWQVSDRLRTSDTVDLQAVGRLEPRDCLFGQRAVAPIDRARDVARPIQDDAATRARAASRLAGSPPPDRARPLERSMLQRLRPADAVDLQTVGGLEASDCLFVSGPYIPSTGPGASPARSR